MKILAVDHTAVASYDRGLYAHMARGEGVDLTLLVPEEWREPYGRVTFSPEVTSLRVVPGRIVFNGRSHRVLYRSLGALIRDVHPDILYVNAEPESFLAAQAVIMRKRLLPESKLVIDSWRNLDYRSVGYPYKFAGIHRRIEESVRAAADDCIAHSETIRATLAAEGFQHITVIPPGVDTSIFAPESRETSRGGSDTIPAVGYVGRLVAGKGIDILLRAVAKLDRRPRLILVGDGPERGWLESLAGELGLGALTTWVGGVLHPELPAYLHRMDVLVLPSITGRTWTEQFGRVLIEAMACGVPVVGSTSGEIPRVIDGAGMLFNEGDPSDLSGRLAELLADEALRMTLREKGLARVKENFSIDLVAPWYVRLFRRLIGDPTG